MKKTFALSCLILAGAACGLKAVDQHHVWNRTGETIELKFEHNKPGYCGTNYAILHSSSPSPYGSSYGVPSYPDWLQRIERVGAENCPLKKLVVIGLTGKIKGKWAELVYTSADLGGTTKPVHFMIDRDGDTISISTHTGDPRNIYKTNPTQIPELILKRHDDATEKLAGQKYYYAWNSSILMNQNIKKELKQLERKPDETPAAHKERVLAMVAQAQKDRNELEQRFNSLTK